MKTFDELFEGVIKHEGYYANVEGDRGGETYMGVARNLHPDWKGWEYIDAYKETYGEIKWNFKIDIPELADLVKEFYKKTFYDRFKIDGILSSLEDFIQQKEISVQKNIPQSIKVKMDNNPMCKLG